MCHSRCVLLLKFVSLHCANIVLEARADIGVTKLRPRDISLICLNAPLGDCFLLWRAGVIAKLFVDRFRGFGVLNFLFSLGIGCLPYNVSATIQTVIDKVHFFVSKLNTPWALMALWINYDPKTSTFYSFWQLCQQLNDDFNDFGVANAEKIWHKNLIDLFTSPVRCSQFTLENAIKIYSRALFIRTSTSRRVGSRVSHYTAVEPLVYISSCWDAGQPLQNLGTAWSTLHSAS